MSGIEEDREDEATVEERLQRRCPIIPKREKHSETMSVTQPEASETDRQEVRSEVRWSFHLMSQAGAGTTLAD